MPTDTKNSTANASFRGSEFGRCLVAEVGFAEHDAGEECAQRKGHAEQLGRPVGNAERNCQNRKGEQLARAGAGDQLEEPRHHPCPDQKNQRHEQSHFADGESKRRGHAAAGEVAGNAAGIPSQSARQRRQEHKSEDHHEVLDDQPSDRNPAVDRIQPVALLQCAQQHDGARDGQSQSQHEAGAEAPAPQKRKRDAAGRGNGDLHNSAGECNGAHCQQVLD